MQTDFEIKTAVIHLSFNWKKRPKTTSILPLLIFGDPTGCNQEPFCFRARKMFHAEVISMLDLYYKTKEKVENAHAAIQQLLSKAAELSAPLILVLQPPLLEQIDPLRQTLKKMQGCIHSLFGVFFPVGNKRNTALEEKYDLVMEEQWCYQTGEGDLVIDATVYLTAACLQQKLQTNLNFQTPWELITAQLARKLLAHGLEPTAVPALPNSFQSILPLIANGAADQVKRFLPATQKILDQKYPTKEEVAKFFLHCAMQTTHKRADRVFYPYPDSREAIKREFARLGFDRHIDKDTFILLAKQGSKQFPNHNWWMFDENRICFEGFDNTINATFVHTDRWKFITTSYPAADHLTNFWKLVLKFNPGIIVSLSMEGENLYNIKHEDEKERLSVQRETICSLTTDTLLNEIACLYQGQEKSFKQIHFKNWIDGNRIEPRELHALVVQVVIYGGKETMPLIHCRAGVGRTGTFCAALELYKRYNEHRQRGHAKKEFKPDIYSLVLQMGLQRYLMVHTPLQYALLYHYVDFLKRL